MEYILTGGVGSTIYKKTMVKEKKDVDWKNNERL